MVPDCKPCKPHLRSAEGVTTCLFGNLCKCMHASDWVCESCPKLTSTNVRHTDRILLDMYHCCIHHLLLYKQHCSADIERRSDHQDAAVTHIAEQEIRDLPCLQAGCRHNNSVRPGVPQPECGAEERDAGSHGALLHVCSLLAPHRGHLCHRSRYPGRLQVIWPVCEVHSPPLDRMSGFVQRGIH